MDESINNLICWPATRLKTTKSALKTPMLILWYFFQFGVVCVLRLGVKKCTLSCPPGAKKWGRVNNFVSLAAQAPPLIRRRWQWVTWRQQRWNGPTSRRQANFRQQAEFDIDHIQVPRTRKPPVRQTGPAPAYQPVNVNQYCSVEYYKLIDTASVKLNKTVNQERAVCYGVLESSEWFH